MEIVFGVHAHQPVGNPDEIIMKAFERCYTPFLETLLKFSNIKIAFHISGYLLEWALENRADFIEILKELVKTGNIELLGGGFYEPIVSSIPREDAIEQIKLFSNFLEEVFGKRPRGAWLTERVWEPCIPALFKEAGIDYTFVDDYHFLCMGFKEEELNGYYCTEYNGQKLFLFPTSQKLRYYIPFKNIDSVLELLRSINGLGIIFDDYEKFGLWPDTYEWVYEKGWLKSFFKLISEGRIKTLLPSEVLETKKALGLAYLPTVSYFEMGEWSLPAETALTFKELISYLEKEGIFQKYKGIIRGGHWKNFLRKYPESNYMHKKMYLVSKLVKNIPDSETKEKAKRHLYRAQCNDAYWHGIFGGIYFPHLRENIFKELSKAERLALGERKETFIEDIDMDGSKEIYISTPKITCVIKPSLGASIRELTFHPRQKNLINTLSRKKEHYHVIQEGLKTEKKTDSISTIHERVYKLNIHELDFDEYERTFGYEEIILDEGKTRINLLNEDFEIISYDNLSFEFKLNNSLLKSKNIDFKKKIEMLDNGLKIMYLLNKKDFLSLKLFFNLKLTSIDNDYSLIKVKDKSEPISKFLSSEGNKVEIEDKLASLKLLFITDCLCQISAKQIYTISQTEEGYDTTYQATELILKPQIEKECLLVTINIIEC
ncbi:MAG: DUF1925 domain-containing protein [Synergistetes bacterium]|nr:DUF1925 domain-containing protein [Synergistota bacterium]MCX8127821.1 DUF1925 domain-containing protein [Synergistota bacterium]MDW8192083.1 DUF1925 domain-containing protein [Synergistota bacterium]